jgi:hypothetical protein
MVRFASGRSANPLPLMLCLMQDQAAQDVSHNLPPLAALIAALRLKNIVELGNRAGNIALVLLEAAQKSAGR